MKSKCEIRSYRFDRISRRRTAFFEYQKYDFYTWLYKHPFIYDHAMSIPFATRCLKDEFGSGSYLKLLALMYKKRKFDKEVPACVPGGNEWRYVDEV